MRKKTAQFFRYRIYTISILFAFGSPVLYIEDSKASNLTPELELAQETEAAPPELPPELPPETETILPESPMDLEQAPPELPPE